ncbi:hypothetical protein NC651_031488 [Populus alba x Populus x berolinensis]|nr:hypothetical protein NC651_031488 [Populus alba x Populus x berolinensis]
MVIRCDDLLGSNLQLIVWACFVALIFAYGHPDINFENLVELGKETLDNFNLQSSFEDWENGGGRARCLLVIADWSTDDHGCCIFSSLSAYGGCIEIEDRSPREVDDSWTLSLLMKLAPPLSPLPNKVHMEAGES